MDALVSEINSLEGFHQLALNEQLAFVTYKLPSDNDITTLVQLKTEPTILSNLKELEGKSGFVFAPFNQSSTHPIWLIQPDLIVTGNNFNESFADLLSQYKHVKGKHPNNNQLSLYEVTRDEFVNQINDLQLEMANSNLDKLVLSRISIEKMHSSFNPTSFFKELQCSYPDAFVFMLHIAEVGLWFGASPEPLLQIKGNRVSTVSLAGTRMYNINNTFSDWGKKELEEQEIVTRYIESILNDFNISDFTKNGPKSQSAGAIEHLLTRFSFDLDALKGRTLEFLDAIHPTPSVCGLPKEMAFEVIKSTEKHCREYYTGFLGPYNISGELNLFVNLRSLKAVQDKLVYFVGAGITQSSESSKEWEETNSKKNTLKTIIDKINTI